MEWCSIYFLHRAIHECHNNTIVIKQGRRQQQQENKQKKSTRKAKKKKKMMKTLLSCNADLVRLSCFKCMGTEWESELSSEVPATAGHQSCLTVMGWTPPWASSWEATVPSFPEVILQPFIEFQGTNVSPMCMCSYCRLQLAVEPK